MIIAATSLRSATTTIRTKVTRSSVVHITRQSQLDFWPHIRRLSDKSFRHLTKQIAANDSLPHIRLRMSSSTTAPTMSQFVFPPDQPVVRLDAAKAFNALAPQEQLYSHYLSRASWYGGLIVLLQTSPESVDIFRLLQHINSKQDVLSLKEAVASAGVTDEEFSAYLIYCSGFYGNMGNYKGFGDSKFIPNLSVEQFGKIVKSSEAWKICESAMSKLWESVKAPLYSLSDKEQQLGIGEKGVTKYFSANCDMTDSDLVNNFFKHKNIEGYINRTIKTVQDGKVHYEIRHAGGDSKMIDEEDFEGVNFSITTGDYQALLNRVSDNLVLAGKHCSNQLEKDMLEQYSQSFLTGSLDRHKDGSRHWIKNKGPIVETYIGFIETYRDPAGMRGEFEGFVAMVNKEMSTKFQTLVSKAEELLPLLPWSKEFEKDKFLKPDFTSLDVLTFAGSGVPAGINIPNYDEIRQSEGFKNVSLGNVIGASYAVKNNPFISDSDNELFKKYKIPSFEVQVGLHELLGHGSGKLFYEGNFPKDLTNPLTGEPVHCCYGVGETYDSKFTTIGSSLEECRAECVGLHLSLLNNVLEIFGHSGAEAEDIKYVNWLSLLHAGLKGLEMFSTASGEWKQAHSQCRYVIMQVLIEAGEDFVKIEQVVGSDGKPDLLLSMDRNKLETVGRPAIAKFLQTLQVYKSMGDDKAARQMYAKYSEVPGDGPRPWAAWRDIVVARKQPRVLLVQANTKIEDEKLRLVEYEANPAGMVQSWADRFPDYDILDKELEQLDEKDKQHW